jgi:hypothetical protein
MIQWLIVRLLLRHAMKFQALQCRQDNESETEKAPSQFDLVVSEWMPAKVKRN